MNGILPRAQAAVLFLGLVVMQLLIHNKLVDRPHQSLRQAYHAQFIAGVYEAPHQYRVLATSAAEILQRAGVRFRWSYLLWRGVGLLAAAWPGTYL